MAQTAKIYTFKPAQGEKHRDGCGEGLLEKWGRGHVPQKNLDNQAAGALAVTLDQTLEDMISQLENVSSCQQSGPAAVQLEEIPAFASFCAGLETAAVSLFRHFQDVYLAEMQTLGLDPAQGAHVYDARAKNFTKYLVQLAQVHGLAFDGAPDTIGAFEKGVLAHFEAKLRIMSLLKI